MRTAISVVLCVMLASVVAARAADDDTEDEARLKYESAFARDLKGKERVKILEGVAVEYHNTEWADDSLWVLAEMADRGRYREKAIEFRKQLMEREAVPALQPFTRLQRIYRDSRVPKVEWLLRYTGRQYGRRGQTVLIFNPVPMLTAESLAMDYGRSGRHELAVKAYRRALSLAPSNGFFTKIYTRRIGRLESRIKAMKKVHEGKESAEKTADAGKHDREKKMEAHKEEGEQHQAPEGGERREESVPEESKEKGD